MNQDNLFLLAFQLILSTVLLTCILIGFSLAGVLVSL